MRLARRRATQLPDEVTKGSDDSPASEVLWIFIRHVRPPFPDLISLSEAVLLLFAKPVNPVGKTVSHMSFLILTLLSHTDLACHLVDLFNSVLFQCTPIPKQWLVSHRPRTMNLAWHVRVVRA